MYCDLFTGYIPPQKLQTMGHHLKTSDSPGSDVRSQNHTDLLFTVIAFFYFDEWRKNTEILFFIWVSIKTVVSSLRLGRWYVVRVQNSKLQKDKSYLWNSWSIKPVRVNITEGEAFSGTQWHKSSHFSNNDCDCPRRRLKTCPRGKGHKSDTFNNKKARHTYWSVWRRANKHAPTVNWIYTCRKTWACISEVKERRAENDPDYKKRVQTLHKQ